jgi:hypothetical protein
MALFPVIAISISVLFWVVYSALKRSLYYLKHHLVSTIIVVFFMLHPNVMRANFKSYSCEEIEKDEYWLSAELNIKCWEEDHN